MSHPFQMDLLLTRSFLISSLNLRNILDVQLIFSSSSFAPTNRHVLITYIYSLPPRFRNFMYSQGFVYILKKGE